MVQFQIDPVSLPHVASGKVKLLAVFGRNRRPDHPDVPMMKEIYPELDYIVWFGIFAPAGTPELVISRMSQEMNKIAGDPELKQQLHNLALTPHPGTSAEAAALLKSDFERYGKIIRQFNIRSE